MPFLVVMVLEFDHLVEKLALVSRLLMTSASLRRIEEEISRCEVRCRELPPSADCKAVRLVERN
jgi:hypothetical protein